jgi:hypothetical protein
VKHALVVGDSLSMVRQEAGIGLRDLYWYQLHQSLPGLYVRDGAQRNNTSRQILSNEYDVELVAPTAPDLVLLQIGIVDCTPRIVRPWEREVLSLASKLPLAYRFASWFVRRRSQQRYDLTRKHPFSLVPLAEYRDNIAAFLARVRATNRDCWFVHIDIPCPTGPMASRNYGIVPAVERYNQAARDAVLASGGAAIDLFAFTREHPDALLEDGYHLGHAAHHYLADELRKLVGARLSARERAPAQGVS